MKLVAFVLPFGRSRKSLLPLLLLLTLPAVVQGQFTYETNNGTITITSYIGPGGDVTIPDTTNGLPVTSIGDWAFGDCFSLTNVTIGTNVTSIGDQAFFGCVNLTSVMITNIVTNIGDQAFAGCTRLTAITVDTNNPAYSSVDGVLFNKNQTTLIGYPEGKAGSQYTIPNSVTSIGDWAFGWCASLTNVTIGTNVTSIGDYAFGSCNNLTSVTIPNSVTNIGGGTFGGCGSLTAITVDTNNPGYSSVDGVLFNKNQTTLIGYPEGKAGSQYTIPNSVTSIGNSALSGCTLTGVTIPDSVASIGDGAFFGCGGLTNVMIGNGVISIGPYAFMFCSSLTRVYFQGNAPSFGMAVFDCDNNATAYYLPGTTRWTDSYAKIDIPALLWNPQIQTGGATFGVQTNRFGFTITGTANIPIVVEACTNLASASWTPLQSSTLTNGSIYFSDPAWTNYSARFYRIRSP